MATSLSEKIWQDSKLRISAIIVLPALLASTIVFYAITVGLKVKTSFLANQVAENVKSNLLSGNWITTQQLVNKLRNTDVITYAHIKAGDEYIYGPVGEKKYYQHCEVVIDEILETRICSQLLDAISSSLIILAFLFSICSLIIIQLVIKRILSKQNSVQLLKLKKLTRQQLTITNEYSTDVIEFQEVENHLKKIAKQLIKKSEQLETAEEVKRYVHDIRSPLLRIKDVLAVTRANEEIVALIDTLIVNAEKNLDKISSKHIPLTDIKDSFDTVMNLYKDNFVKFGFHSGIPEQCWAGINSDDLVMVMINLIENSIEASSSKFEIRLDEELSFGKRYFKIFYMDKGIGLSSETINELNSGKSVKSSKVNGKGIGLSNIYSFLNTIGGSINYSNNPDGGICAKILIPSHVGENSFEIFHLEDDKFIRENWKRSADKINLNLKSISVEEVKKLKNEPKPIGCLLFLDYIVEDKVITDSILELYQAGFRKIYLATGHSSYDEDVMQIVKGNVGKNPPWEEVR